MNNIFIICEFNPFHFGHEYLLNYAKQNYPEKNVICVMGGNFTQRGDVAVCDKYVRAECAVRCGADAVLLLPAVYACASGHEFALGGIKLCNAFAESGDILLFGSECGDIGQLELLCSRLDGFEFDPTVSDGEPFAVRRARLYREKYGDGSLLSTPNNILALEYLRAIKETHSPLIPQTFKRDSSFESASLIRSRSRDEILSSVPHVCAELYSADPYFGASFEYGSRYVLGELRKRDSSDGISECGGGLGERILSKAKVARSYSELIELCKTKKYPESRIRRAVLALLMSITRTERISDPTFTVLLAGKRVATFLFKKPKLQVISKPADGTVPEFLRECEFDGLYSLMSEQVREEKYYLRQSPKIYN